jgi:hypothetical protein
MFGKFKTNQMHNFQLVLFILFYFSTYMFWQAAIFKRNISILYIKLLDVLFMLLLKPSNNVKILLIILKSFKIL